MTNFKKGQVVITEGDRKSIISWLVRIASKSWLTHGWIVISETEGIEAVIPRVRKFNIQERLAELAKHNQSYHVLDLPNITDTQREQVVAQALTYLGAMYDIWNCVLYGVVHLWAEGGKRLVCSGLMAKSFEKGIGVNIFPPEQLIKLPANLETRKQNMSDGYCTPAEILEYSILKEVSTPS